MNKQEKTKLQNCYKQIKLFNQINLVELLSCIDLISMKDLTIDYTRYIQALNIVITKQIPFNIYIYLDLIWQYLLKQNIQTIEVSNKQGKLISIFYNETDI